MENIVRKGEIACNKQFLLFSQCFIHLYIFSASKCLFSGYLFQQKKRSILFKFLTIHVTLNKNIQTKEKKKLLGM